jgi:hypothetical protein
VARRSAGGVAAGALSGALPTLAQTSIKNRAISNDLLMGFMGEA